MIEIATPAPAFYEVTCPNCGARLKYTLGDVRSSTYVGKSGRGDPGNAPKRSDSDYIAVHPFIDCPVEKCRQQIAHIGANRA